MEKITRADGLYDAFGLSASDIHLLDSIKSGAIAILWNIEDVQQERPGLSDEQAKAVLQAVKDNHNATIGVNWDVLKSFAEDLFPEPKTCRTCGNFESYEDEEDGYADCAAGCGTVHESGSASECEYYL